MGIVFKTVKIPCKKLIDLCFNLSHAPKLIHSNSSPPFVFNDSMKEALASDKASRQKANGFGLSPFSFSPGYCSNLKKMLGGSSNASTCTIKVTRNLKTANGLCYKRTMGNSEQIHLCSEVIEQNGRGSRVFPALA
jgi:hypothetical protein